MTSVVNLVTRPDVAYLSIFAKENGSGIGTTTVKADGIDGSDKGFDSPTTETYGASSVQTMTAVHTYYNNLTYTEENLRKSGISIKYNHFELDSYKNYLYH